MARTATSSRERSGTLSPENNKEEEVRAQPNRGEVSEDIDVHCLAGLISLVEFLSQIYVEFIQRLYLP